MKSQFVTSRVKRGQNLKYLPYVFTEQGVTQLSAVLRSDVAVEMSIRINDAFHAMRHFGMCGQGSGAGGTTTGSIVSSIVTVCCQLFCAASEPSDEAGDDSGEVVRF